LLVLLSFFRHNIEARSLFFSLYGILKPILPDGALKRDWDRLASFLATIPRETTIFRRLDFLHGRFVAGQIPWPTAAFRTLFSHSCLATSDRFDFILVQDLYAVTHTAFYLSDFGRRRPPVSNAALRRVAEKLALIEAYCQKISDIDILCEVVLARTFWAGEPVSSLAQELLIRTQLSDGSWPAPPDVVEAVKADGFDGCALGFYTKYHATLLARDVLARSHPSRAFKRRHLRRHGLPSTFKLNDMKVARYRCRSLDDLLLGCKHTRCIQIIIEAQAGIVVAGGEASQMVQAICQRIAERPRPRTAFHFRTWCAATVLAGTHVTGAAMKSDTRDLDDLLGQLWLRPLTRNGHNSIRSKRLIKEFELAMAFRQSERFLSLALHLPIASFEDTTRALRWIRFFHSMSSDSLGYGWLDPRAASYEISRNLFEILRAAVAFRNGWA
jgi:hypothetical protein